MIEVTGTIETIELENNNGQNKKIITLQAGRNNKLFIEFQGKMIYELDTYSVGNKVSIRVRFNGKISKLKRKYNNIIGKSIKSI